MEAERVAVRIHQKLLSISPISSDCYIFKVPNYLRKVNEKAYEPEVVAIGPYHRGKDHLEPMEARKFWLLRSLLRERMENDITKYVVIMRQLEQKARKCYAEPLSLDSDDFVEMMLLDGCLIIQLIRYFLQPIPIDDPVFKISGFHAILCRDMLLVENQLPLFVLWELFRVIVVPTEDTFIRCILAFFTDIAGKWCINKSVGSITETKHLLGLIHDCWHCSAFEMEDYPNKTKPFKDVVMPCATELKEAGIRFKKAKGTSIFDIEFENGTMKIPSLEIDDNTEWFLRNVIAYEQFFSESSLNFATDYMHLMDCLINSQKDVEILRQRGIIENCLGDDEVIATMFNRLGDSVTIPACSLYSEVFNNVNKYCAKRKNKWIANLKHNYFNSPWALVSILAAVLLLLLTMVQTVFSVLCYVK